MRAIGVPARLAMAILVVVSGVAHAEGENGIEPTTGTNYIEKYTGLALHGFANMGYAADTSTDNHRRFARGFYLNNFDLYYNPDIGDRVRFLSEVVFEPDAEDQSPSFDAERLQAGYVFNNALTVWVGRFHTPIGYYAIAYHHGMQLQTAVEKPRFLDFEDHYGVIPVHTNGLWFNGNLTFGAERLAVMAWLGNSDRITTDGANFSGLDFNMGHTDNAHQHLATGARVNWVASGKLDGLQLGATILSELIDSRGGGSPTYGTNAVTQPNQTNPVVPGAGGVPDTSINPNTGGSFSSSFLMYGMHLTYEAHGFEFLNEAYGFNNSDRLDSSGAVYKSFAGYSQLAYWIDGKNAPYARFEHGAFSTKDPYFAGQYNGLPYSKSAGGYRYNVSDNAALKVEVSRTLFYATSNTNNGQNFNDVHMDYSVRF